MRMRATIGSPRRSRGAALLIAMVLLTLVSTLAAGMVWQQNRAIQVEAAERARTQSAWILNGALDWYLFLYIKNIFKFSFVRFRPKLSITFHIN